ncbi:MAG: hydrogenase iron-sulfur subunit [Rhodopseudomonas palustris]|nr:hydrogenase iron-sulfur subunit [Rhodopseudomonas palustris]
MAGTARMKYAPNVRLIRLMCSGRLDPTFVIKALAGGADGVLITGCHPGDCHYIEQNYKALRRFLLLQRVLERHGHRARSACKLRLGQRRRRRELGRRDQHSSSKRSARSVR